MRREKPEWQRKIAKGRIEILLNLAKNEAKKHNKVNIIAHHITEPWPYSDDFLYSDNKCCARQCSRTSRFFVAKELANTIRKKGLVVIYEPSYKDGYYDQY